MSAGLPAVTKAAQTGSFQRFFQEACVEKTGLSIETISHIFAYYNSKINKPTYILHQLDGIRMPLDSQRLALACSTLGGQAITYFHSMVETLRHSGRYPFFQHALGVFDPSIPPIDPYSRDFSRANKMESPPPLPPLLTQLASCDTLICTEDVGFTAKGTTLTHHVRTNTRAATRDNFASSHYPIDHFSSHDRVRVMAYNPRISKLMIGTTEGVVASKDFTEASVWRGFPQAPFPTSLHFLAPRDSGFVAVSPTSINVNERESILKTVASASDVMQFRTAAYNPYQDTLGVVCRFEGFNTVREYSLATGAYTGEMHFETEVIALSYFHEKWVIVTETSSENPIVREQNILILGVAAGEIYSNSPLQERTQKLPPEASQVIHKQYLATTYLAIPDQEPAPAVIMTSSENRATAPRVINSYEIVEKGSFISRTTIGVVCKLPTINS